MGQNFKIISVSSLGKSCTHSFFLNSNPEHEHRIGSLHRADCLKNHT